MALRPGEPEGYLVGAAVPTGSEARKQATGDGRRGMTEGSTPWAPSKPSSVAVIVIVAGPVIVAVHVHGNATVGVIEGSRGCLGWDL